MTSYFPRDVGFVPLFRSRIVTVSAESSSFVIIFLGATGLTSIVPFCPSHHCLSSVVRDKTLRREAAEGTKHEGDEQITRRVLGEMVLFLSNGIDGKRAPHK